MCGRQGGADLTVYFAGRGSGFGSVSGQVTQSQIIVVWQFENLVSVPVHFRIWMSVLPESIVVVLCRGIVVREDPCRKALRKLYALSKEWTMHTR